MANNDQDTVVYMGIPLSSLTEKAVPDVTDKFLIETAEGPRVSKWENVIEQVTGGWNIVAEEIEDGERVVKKIVSFTGGVPPLPQALTDLVGKYFAAGGGFTTDISLATNYKGTAGADGRSLVSITKTSTVGNVDTYTVLYSDGDTFSYEVKNGADAKLPLYSAIKSANIVAGTQFIDDENGNIQYRVKIGQTLNVGELPSNFIGSKVDQIGGSDPKVVSALTTFVKSVTTTPISNLTTLRVAGWLLNDNTIQTGTSNYVVKDLDVLTVDYFDFVGVRAKRSDIGATFLLGTLPDNSIEVIAPATSKTTTPNVTETLRFNIKKYSKISFSYSNTAVPVINLVTGDVATADAVKKEIDAKVSNADAVMLNGSETTGLSTNQIFKVLGDFKNTGIEANLATALVSGWIQSTNNSISSGAVLQSQKDIPVIAGQTYIYHSSLPTSVHNPPVSVLGVTADGLFLPLLKSGAGVVPNDEKMYEIVIPSNVVTVSVTFNTAATVKSFGLKKMTLPQSVKSYIDAKTVNVPSMQARLDKLDIFALTAPAGGVLSLNLTANGNFKSTITTTDALSIIPRPLNNVKDQMATLYLKLTALPTKIELPPNSRWKDGTAPTFAAGSSYFIMFQSFDFGVNWIVSVIGSWETKTLIAFDNFMRPDADGGTGMGSTFEGGLPWVGMAGTTWGIKNNKPYQVTTVNTAYVAVTPPTPYILVTGIFTAKHNNNGIAFRILDASNFSSFYLDPVGNNVIRRKHGGPGATAYSYPITPADFYILQVKLEPNANMTYYCNGKEIYSEVVSDNQNAAGAGLYYSFGNTVQTDCYYFSISEL